MTFSLRVYTELVQKNHVISLLIIFHVVGIDGYVFSVCRRLQRTWLMIDLGQTGLKWEENKTKLSC